MTITRTYFTVQGNSPFPTDMLRYDVCWPVNQDSSIPRTFDREGGRSRLIEVALATDAINRPTVGRWNSFGWGIVPDSIRTVKR